jgi:hypothetical protein
MMCDLGIKKFRCFSSVCFKENLDKNLVLQSEIKEHKDKFRNTECI